MKRLLILVLMLCCTSCSALPAEERAFAVALCVERSGEEWQVHSRIPAYKTGGKYMTVTGKGTTIAAALMDMDAAALMAVTLSQLRLMVLNTNLDQGSSISDVLAEFVSMLDVRPQCAVAVTEESSDAVMEALDPDTGARLSKALDVLLEARIEQGVIPSAKLADVIRMGDRKSPVLIGLGLDKGRLDLAGAWPLKQDGHLASPLDAEETILLSLLTGKAKDIRVVFPEGTALIREASESIQLSVDQRIARIRLYVKADESDFTPTELEQKLALALVNLMSRLSEAGCDVLGLGRKAALQAQDANRESVLPWPEAYREIRWEISVGVTSPA